MKTSELRHLILSSTNPEWFNNIEQTFNFSYINSTISLKGITAIHEFVSKQVDGWNQLSVNFPDELKYSLTYFENIRGKIEFLVSNNQNQINENSLNISWREIKSLIENTRRYPLKYNCSEVHFLMSVHEKNPLSFSSAFNFLIKNETFSVNSKDQFIGMINAYEFIAKDSSLIFKRGVRERKSIDSLRDEIEQKCLNSERTLSEHLFQANKKVVELSQVIDTLKTDKKELFEKWFNEIQFEQQNFAKITNEKITSLEKTYEELLRLKKPADYWKLRALELKREGRTFLNLLVTLVIISSAILFSLLWLTPEDMLKSFFSNDKSVAVRWSIIFITLISFLAFGIKALTKVTFSSFHLARDAEERERLTYVYLALMKDSHLPSEDRSLIMQSLFSRADTGLLKEDSSPTMPMSNAMIEKIK